MLNKPNWIYIMTKIICVVILFNIALLSVNTYLDQSGMFATWAKEKRERQLEYDKTHTEKYIVYNIKKHENGTYSFSYMGADKNSTVFKNFDPIDWNKHVYPGTFDNIVIKEYPLYKEYHLFLK